MKIRHFVQGILLFLVLSQASLLFASASDFADPSCEARDALASIIARNEENHRVTPKSVLENFVQFDEECRLSEGGVATCPCSFETSIPAASHATAYYTSVILPHPNNIRFLNGSFIVFEFSAFTGIGENACIQNNNSSNASLFDSQDIRGISDRELEDCLQKITDAAVTLGL